MNSLDFLFIFAHPDDEAFYCGGLISEAVACGLTTHVLCLTPGNNRERTNEFWQALSHLKTSGTLSDFPDGQLDQRADELVRFLRSYITKHSPKHIVTFGDEPYYNHRDHLVVEQASEQALHLAQSTSLLWKRAYLHDAGDALQKLRSQRPVTHNVRILDSAALITYEVPNLTVPISRQARDSQLAGLACHRSQHPDALIKHIEEQPLHETYSVCHASPSHTFEVVARRSSAV
jgi:LmbE family N-acetylglucosaminyl deacetylase